MFMLSPAAVHTRAAERLGACWRFTGLVWKCWGLCDTVLQFSSAGKPWTDRTAAELLALPQTADPVPHAASYTVLWMQEHAESPLELQRWAAYTSGGGLKTKAEWTHLLSAWTVSSFFITFCIADSQWTHQNCRVTQHMEAPTKPKC